ncbi:MAG: lytic transglycosylase domain-containing protein [Chitinophagaceae bacterium]|nr:lytic transglycosylase domain-containing protein [Chitinophagaceae bacterium]MCB9046031.1 lytic transglycosylase domain-containing protein [Chitinophagales bacterium]
MKLKPIVYFSFGVMVCAAVVAGFSFRASDKGEEVVEVKKNRKLQYKWFVPDLPEQISFAGEPVPLQKWDVRELLQEEILGNSYRHSHTMQILLRSTRYFPVIEQRLRANGVPDDFKYLCVAESSLTPARSPAGARGFWQFMDGTAPRYGLELDKEVDERYHLEKATDAACQYLKEAYAKFGSWTAAAASYNCGVAGYSRNADYQKQDNYYDVLLPDETMHYLFRILAFKYIMTNPEQLGFNIQRDEAYRPIPVRKVTVTESIPDLASFAMYNGTNYRMLKLLNPWLRDQSLTISKGNSYVIDLPLK